MKKTPSPKAVGLVIRDARIAAGLSVHDMADRIGIKYESLWRLEREEYTGHSLRMLRKIAAALGKEVEVLFRDP